jgi:hypothetical protein
MLLNTDKISRYAIIGGIASLLLLTVLEAEIFLPALWLLFMLTGNVFYRGRTERNLFRLNFNISLFLLPFFLWSYTLQTGKPFIAGGDSERYYNDFMDLLDGRVEIHSLSRYILYYIVSWKYYALVKFAMDSTSYLYLVFLTIFISANTAPLLYKIGRNENFNEKILLNACLMTCIFPSLVEISTAILREGFTVAAFLFSVYLSQKIKNTGGAGKLKYILLLLLAILWMANMRFEVSVAATLFFVLYNYVFTDNFSLKNYVYLCFIALLAVLLVLPNIVALQLDYYNLNSKRELLDARSLEQADSLTASLRHQGFAGRFFLFFYCTLLPIPPHLFSYPAVPHYYLLAMGNVLWYFVLPISSIEIFGNIRRKVYPAFSKSYLAVSIAAVFIVSVTYLGSERLKIYIYPIMFLFFFHYIANHSKRQKIRMFTVLFFLYVLVVVAYILVKTF